MPAPAQFVLWDSEFFGVRIGRARIDPGEDPLVVAASCDADGFECTYLLVDSADAATVGGAQRAGFRVVDIRITLDRQVGNADGSSENAAEIAPLHVARSEDVPRLRTIARAAFTDTRFYRDGRFARERCAEMYDTWIAKDCDGRSDVVIVSAGDSGPTGFISCSKVAPDSAQIGLVAVDPAARGRRTGVHLVAAAVRWAARNGLDRISVVTQGSNIAALRAYESSGFRIRRSELWLHRWADETQSEAPCLHPDRA